MRGTPAEVEAASEMIGDLIWLALLHGLWIGLLVPAVIAWILPAIGGRARHGSRLAALMAGLIAATAGPVVVAAVLLAARSNGPAEGETVVPIVSVGGIVEKQIDEDESIRDDPSGPGVVKRGAGLVAGVAGLVSRLRPIAVIGWGAGAAALGLGLAVGAIGQRRLVRGSSPAPEAIWRRAEALADGLGMRSAPEVRVREGMAEPCLVGFRRPVILLPGGWLEAEGNRGAMLDAVLAHELAHARRRDPAWNLFQRLLDVLSFHHPGVRWLSRLLRRQREVCADALAVRLTGDPISLARALESVARVRSDRRGFSRPAVSFGGHRSSLLPRIQELLGMMPNHTRIPRWPLAALPMALVFALVASSAGQARDDDEPAGRSLKPPALVLAVPPAKHLPFLAPPFTDLNQPQISYEVQLVEFEKGYVGFPGQNAIIAENGPVVLTAGDIEVRGRGFTTSLPHVRVTSAPKVTAFEEVSATIGFNPSDEPLRAEGIRLMISGTTTRDREEIRLSVTASDAMAEEIGAGPPGSGVDVSPIDSDDPELGLNESEPWFQKTCIVPEGGCLIIPAPAREGAEADDLNRVDRLILITPRRIILEEAEERLGVPAVPIPPAAPTPE